MNICVITSQYPPIINNGMGNAVYRITKNLALAGFNVHVIAPSPPQAGFPIPVVEQNVTVHRIISMFTQDTENPYQFRDTGEYVLKLHAHVDFDLVHATPLLPSGLIAAMVAKTISQPMTVCIWGEDLEVLSYSPVLSGSLRWVLDQASLVIARDDRLLKKAKLLSNINQCLAIPDAFDPTVFDLRPLDVISRDQKILPQLFMKRLIHRKQREKIMIGTDGFIKLQTGGHLLLEAFCDFRQAFSEAQLLIMGAFTDRNEYHMVLKQIKALKLKKQVSVTGPIPHRQRLSWMKQMDIFVSPSFDDSFQQTILEAMGCGLPVVAYNECGTSGLFKDGYNCSLVSSDSIEELSYKLKTLGKDDQLRRSLGQAAKQTVEDRFSPEEETTLWMTAFYELLSSRC